jgi:hypothetical protein
MLANGTLPTIEDEEDIYVSLTALCEYFAKSTITMRKEIKNSHTADKRYAMGLHDMMNTIAQETVELGKFEAQRRMIDGPEDLLNMIDKAGNGLVE